MTTTTLTIRTAKPGDASQVCSLGIQTFREAFGAFNTEANMQMYFDQTFTPEKIEAELNDSESMCLLAEDNGVPVGYAKLRKGKQPLALNELNTVELQRIYAVKKYLGKGVGKVLLEACLTYARQHNYDAIWLGVWEHNDHAQDFYKRWGFEKFGQHIFTLGTDDQTDFLMVKKL